MDGVCEGEEVGEGTAYSGFLSNLSFYADKKVDLNRGILC